MIKRMITILIVFGLMVTAGCASTSKVEEGGNLPTEPTKGTLTIGTEGTYPPFTYHDEAGKLTGFDVELAEEVCKRLGYTPKFVEAKWDGMIAGLDAKRYDMVANEVAIREDRLEKYAMSDPYIVSRAVLVVHSKNDTIKTLADLKGKKVGQSLDSNYRTIAEEHGAINTVVTGFNQAIDLLVSGRIDATLNDSLSYLDVKKVRPDLPIKTVFEGAAETKNGFMFRKGSEELVQQVNQALSDMKSDGTYERISTKYFNSDVSK